VYAKPISVPLVALHQFSFYKPVWSYRRQPTQTKVWFFHMMKNVWCIQVLRVTWLVSGICRYSPGNLTSFRGMQILSQVPWPVSGICRYSPGTLTSVKDMQILSRYPDWCQGYAGILQLPWLVSRICRYSPGNLTSFRVCRYPPGTLTSVRDMQVLPR